MNCIYQLYGDTKIIRGMINFLFLSLLFSSVVPVNAAETADSVYFNGRIYTQNKDLSWEEAVAIKDGRFLAVGKTKAIKKFIGKDTEVIDLTGKMVMPGIHDAHTHYIEAGSSMFDCVVMPAPSTKELRKRLSACGDKTRSGWLVINAKFDLEDIVNFKELLDDLYPDVAVVVRDFSFHNNFGNSKALKLAGITKETPDPEGGHIVRDPITGEATGLMVEKAHYFLYDKIPAYTVEEKIEMAQDAANQHSRFGITSAQESSASVDTLNILSSLEKAGGLTQFVSIHLRGLRESYNPNDEQRIEYRDKYQSALISADAVKVFLDGVPSEPLFTHVKIKEDNTIDETNLLVDQDVLTKNVIAWDRLGLRIKMHATGEGAVRVALNAYEYARKVNGDSGIIHELGHSNFISSEDIKRLKQLNVAADLSPGWGGLPSRKSHEVDDAWKFRTLLGAGALLTAGSDAPIFSKNPFPFLQNIITRDKESIDLASALTILTRNGAKVTGREKDLGSIESGKVANMIVLNQNLFDIPVSDIAKTQVLNTVFRGDVVYKAVP